MLCDSAWLLIKVLLIINHSSIELKDVINFSVFILQLPGAWAMIDGQVNSKII